MGLLDKNDRVVDIVLTAEGRRQLSLGELEFRYFAVFDDEVDYDPYIPNSGSLTDVQLREQRLALTEDSFVFEAVSGLSAQNARDRDHTALPRDRLFEMPQGAVILPRMSFTPDVTSGSLEVRQALISADGPENLPAGVVRQDPTVFGVRFDVQDGFADAKDVGVLVRVFSSGSDGLQEIEPVRDYSGDLSYGLALKAFADVDDGEVARRIARFEGKAEV